MVHYREDRPLWDAEGRDWPNRGASRFVRAAGLAWHVQELGPEGAPALLLVHGTGAATHSWRGLMPRLAERFRVVAPDLPGHGFTDPLPDRRLSLPGMAAAIIGLAEAVGCAPAVVVGHSAGAAILARACLDGGLAPRLLVALNGALKPFPGMAGLVFPGMARMLFLNPVTPRIFAWSADRAAVERLIRGTGSRLDGDGLDLYRRLFRKPGHIAGALGMMANWNLDALDRDLPALKPRALLVVGSEDRAILPETAFAVRDRLADARVELIRGLGHLAHEEAPERVAETIFQEAEAAGIIHEEDPAA
ncbi:alpha/beta fold hydrolase BchO [Methylobacterium oxalidis]|uniref:Alpha/beta hydrolase n=1 Tax=Methylobacterium oxalidis TaxID=944322 RepID=A0A512IWD3_9HYPH|nr:alpha/beta fold hydrolase BchO [Methylobacterium oxalidis]GEP02022.1 alpha/beta hydrolase [Methylobacterium oxalidis]GJE31397.1 2-succinyl-6-hydroxy-2, 4-cyclohexadiene-1-carboxylate synthase [Methylobacterium oxalidis]GLS61967.1 alpha/beta hydrolase [Methylobacterium oxalidis]